MAILDYFKNKKGRGVREPLHPNRAVDQGTKQLPIAGQPHPLPRPPGPPDATVVAPVNPSSQPNPNPRPVHSPPRVDPANLSDKPTVYVKVGGHVAGGVVGVLVAIEGEFEGEVYKVRNGENKIGRSEDCQIQIPGESISRTHAMLIHKDGLFAIQTLSNNNPTYVNGAQISETAELSDGASVKVGPTLLRFRSIE